MMISLRVTFDPFTVSEQAMRQQLLETEGVQSVMIEEAELS